MGSIVSGVGIGVCVSFSSLMVGVVLRDGLVACFLLCCCLGVQKCISWLLSMYIYCTCASRKSLRA